MSSTAAKQLVEAIAAWDAADRQLECAMLAYLHHAIIGSRGVGSFDALQRLREHLAFDRYRVPATAIELLDKEPPVNRRP